jgi:hypothetical protein
MADKIFYDEEDNNVDIPKEKRALNTASYDYSVDYIATQMTNDSPKIILEVPFQRKQVWKSDRSSQLIESIIMNVPIPPLYFAEEEDGKWLVIDGLQRLTAIKTFFQNEFALKKMEIIKELEGIKFKDLPQKAKDLLKDGLLRINVIKKDSHPDIKYDIFMRLNKGAVTLNAQELRNCLYRGTLNNLLRTLSKNPIILKILNQKSPHNRYLDVEFLLRFLAFEENLKVEDGQYSLNEYGGSLKSFLNNYMEKNKNLTDGKLMALSNMIIDTFKKVDLVFGDEYGLKLPDSRSSLINKAYADCVLLSFAGLDESKLIKNKAYIIRKRYELLNDERYREAILKRTSDHKNIRLRLGMWFEAINNAI